MTDYTVALFVLAVFANCLLMVGASYIGWLSFDNYVDYRDRGYKKETRQMLLLNSTIMTFVTGLLLAAIYFGNRYIWDWWIETLADPVIKAIINNGLLGILAAIVVIILLGICKAVMDD